MSSQLRRNGDGILTDCLCFGACCFPCPSISLLLAMFAMHHHSLSLSPSFYLLLPCLIISQRDGSDGWTSGYLRGETMETRHLLSVNTVWSSVAPHKDTTQLALFNSLALSYSVSIYLSFHCPNPPTPSTSVSMSLCASQTCLISRFDQNNWRWPCC